MMVSAAEDVAVNVTRSVCCMPSIVAPVRTGDSGEELF